MKNITNLTSTQIRIFKSDAIPYYHLRTNSALNEINKEFKFLSTKSDSGENRIKFVEGEFRTNKSIVPITELIIEPRRLSFSLFSGSEGINLFYQSLTKFLNKFDENHLFKSSKELVKTDQTKCVLDLDIDYKKIFNNKFLDYLNKKVIKATSSELGRSYINTFSLFFELSYELKSSVIQKHGITLSPKEFRIEPRIGTNLNEKRFFTSSPTDSETHLKLIRELEKILRLN